MIADIVFVLAIAAGAWYVLMMLYSMVTRAGTGAGLNMGSAFRTMIPALLLWIAWVVIR